MTDEKNETTEKQEDEWGEVLRWDVSLDAYCSRLDGISESGSLGDRIG